MPEEQAPIEAPTGTTSTDAPAAPTQKQKRKRGRPKKAQPAPQKHVSPPANPQEDIAPVVDFDESKDEDPISDVSISVVFSTELQEIRARLDALEAKNAAVPPPTDTRTNLERAQDRSRLRLEAQKALAAK